MESVEKIRDQVRSSIVESRQASRDKIWRNKRKALNDVIDIGRKISSEELAILSSKLKTKSLLKAEDLALLKIAFTQSADNIVAFLKVKGALHGLVRELSNTKPNFELLAAECICNLALGDEKSCLIVAKAAGPYLITILSGYNINLMATSVSALGNLAGSGKKTLKVLISQGFVGKLLQLISENDNLPDLRQEVLYWSLIALTQLLRVGAEGLADEEIQAIAKTVVNLKNWSRGLAVSLFLLSCIDGAEKELIENKVHLKCLEFVGKTELTVETLTEYTACVRTVANLSAETSGVCAVEVIQNWHCIQEALQKISVANYRHVVVEFGWLLGNLVNDPSPQVQVEVVKFSGDFESFESKFLNGKYFNMPQL